MNVLVVDDEPLARNELSYLLDQCEEVSEIKEADSIEETLANLIDYTVDLIFLDIHLTNESGLTLADKLATLKKTPMIIFATAYDEYAVKAFELNAVDYVLKPFEFSRVQQAVKKAFDQFQKESLLEDEPKKTRVETLPIQVEERIYIIKMAAIIAASVESGETTIYTKEQEFKTHEPLNAWEKKLDPQLFLRVHRSFVINTKEIIEIQPWFNNTYQLTMSNHLKVPVSRSYMKVFRETVGLA